MAYRNAPVPSKAIKPLPAPDTSGIVRAPIKHDIPASAVSVWIDGSDLVMVCPGDGPSTTLRISLERCSIETSGFGKPLARQTGWLVFINTLKERARAYATQVAPRFGERANPVQYDIEQMMRHLTRYDEKGREAVVVSAEDLGI